MKTPRLMITLFGALAAASLAAGCGDNSAQCGEGTVEVDGICVPDDLVECGAGTTNVGGECVPDGTVICEQGTVFDEDQGACVPSADACAEGTVLVDGQCVPEDETLVADEEEAAEPNDGTDPSDVVAGQLAIPAVGESTVIHGCINPYRDLDDNGNPDQDLDLWIVTTTAPALIEVTADGVGGLAAGYQMISATGNDVIDVPWVRFGLNLTGDTSSRQIYLPEAGTYGLWMADSRSLFLQDGAAGSPEACYYTTISNVALPAPTAITVNTVVDATTDGDVDFFAAPPDDGSFFIGVHTLDAAAAVGSVLALKNDEVFEYDDVAPQSVVRTGGLAATDDVVYVIDPVYNYALAPVAYQLEIINPPGGPIPTGGADIVVTNIDTGEDFVGWFDVAADTMHYFDISTTDDVRLVFIDDHGVGIHDTGAFTFVSSFAEWIKFPAAGRYHVIVLEDEAATSVPSVTFNSEIVLSPVVPIVVGTPIDNAPFNDVGATWYSLGYGSTWLSFTAPAATGWGVDLSLDFYDDANVGVPDVNFGSEFFMDIPADGSAEMGHIFLDDSTTYLVKAWDWQGTADGASTFDLTVADRTFEDLGTVSETTPINQAAEAIVVGETLYYLVRGPAGDQATVTVAPTGFDVALELLDREENVLAAADAGGDGVAEVASAVIGTEGFVAFRVVHAGGTGTAFDLAITSSPPKPYDVTTGALAYSNVCGQPGAVTLAQAGVNGFPVGDESVTSAQTMPFSFTLHNLPVSTYYVSSNGFLAFDTFTSTSDAHYANVAIPGASDPNGLVAPYWDDLDFVVICKLETADTVTIQWVGETYSGGLDVQFQAVMHSSGVIDFIYGPTQAATGGSSTVGSETASGTFGTQVSFNTAGSVTASTSRTLTLAP